MKIVVSGTRQSGHGNHVKSLQQRSVRKGIMIVNVRKLCTIMLFLEQPPAGG